MATLIPISTSSQATDKGQTEYEPDGGWHSWTPEEQGGILAASILVFLFLFGLTLFVSLRVPKRHRENRLFDAERGMRERQERRENQRQRRRRNSGGLASVSRALPGPRPQQNGNTYAFATKDSYRHGVTRRFSSDERHRLAPDRHRKRRWESTARSYGRDSCEQRAARRSRSCPGPRDKGSFEGRAEPSGERSRQSGGQRPRESMVVCDGSGETLERRAGSDSTDSYDDGDPGPSTRTVNEKASTHQRNRSEGVVRVERPPRHMRSYSVD
ncbi:hypothetical protein EMCG_06198 [[Emmonsia] crescens]|uniref:Transmembrane protein n=1 Tax=[Emmonsia] crescens TaxID=73230 RepID=A0A0G2JBV5_9EURO|nr:hypothetical protein EMCG_06198 [Emmonsia crescens UAMH 3008]